MRAEILYEDLAKMPKGFVVYDSPYKEGGLYLLFSHTRDNNWFFTDCSRSAYCRGEGGLIGFTNELNDPFYYPNEGEYGYEENKALLSGGEEE